MKHKNILQILVLFAMLLSIFPEKVNAQGAAANPPADFFQLPRRAGPACRTFPPGASLLRSWSSPPSTRSRRCRSPVRSSHCAHSRAAACGASCGLLPARWLSRSWRTSSGTWACYSSGRSRLNCREASGPALDRPQVREPDRREHHRQSRPRQTRLRARARDREHADPHVSGTRADAPRGSARFFARHDVQPR